MLLAAALAGGCAREESGGSANAGASGQAPPPTGTDASSTAALGGNVSPLSDEDKEFLISAAYAQRSEIDLAALAQAKAADPDVKAFAARMATDHGQANQTLDQLAGAKGLSMPTELPSDMKKNNEHLNSLDGAAFDRAYMDHMLADHQKAVADFERYATAVKDPDLDVWIDKTLPTLKEHLRMAQGTHTKVQK
jgi:putative membrane protein